MSKPLSERRYILESLITPVPNEFQVIPWKTGATEKDILETLEQYCSQRFEGVLIKHMMSAYVPGPFG